MKLARCGHAQVDRVIRIAFVRQIPTPDRKLSVDAAEIEVLQRGA